jgi:hypothetical protein
MRSLAIVLSTACFASVGLALGVAVHGPSPWALVQLTSGAAGGLGIGWAGLNVVDRWRASHRPADS